ncbi:glycosyltransferase family 2 protein [Nocardioides sp. JQ2195]|uniref:glycosyltransferase family 2 protein n=1 Tax=Nocardioides sp. JQ2195 TaxID=2592334 RepID=UPI00143EE655|nr:glycosyltransferase family 2 protein [Nocardioides sp. JQ2195]QIX26200.1 glycosyltransferase family 2 protein [Nocardioides sp. JQ2195]
MAERNVPDVSVIIPAYNALPYLHRGLESLVAQTLGTDRMEVLVVDDGSTDGTGEALDEWAERYPDLFRIVHAAASGGPAAPRNKGLDLARGRHVYFLDADDYLGEEALERLVATADDEGSDIVLGKMVATSERAVPSSMYRHNDLDVDLFTSRVWWTLAALKLFRRSLIEDNDLRFPTNFPNASDQPFTAVAYLRARKISVLSDYDFYHVVLRDDGQHVTMSGPVSNELDVAETMCELVESEVLDVDKRAPLLTRHFQIDVALVMRRLVGVPRAEQDALLERVVALVRRHLTADVRERLTPDLRVVYHLADRGRRDEVLELLGVLLEAGDNRPRVVIDGGHAHAQLPFFRDRSVGVPDALYEVTNRLRKESGLESFECHEGGHLTVVGTAGFTDVLEPTEVALVIRSREEPTVEHVVAATRGRGNAFSADADLLTVADGDPLPEGTWGVHVRVSRDGISESWRLGGDPTVHDEQLLDSFAWAATEQGEGWTAAAYLTKGGWLRIDAKWRRGAAGKQFTDWQLAWDDTDLVVRGALSAPRSAAPVRFVLRGPGGEVRRVPAVRDGAHLEGRVSMTGLSEGTWQLRLQVGRPPAHRPVTIRAEGELVPLTWREGLVASRAEQVPGPTVTLELTSTGPKQKASQVLRSLSGG